MIRVHIRGLGGAEASTASKALAFVLVAVGLACVVLLLLGLWILLAIAFTTMAVVALVRAMLPRVVRASAKPTDPRSSRGAARRCAICTTRAERKVRRRLS